MQKVFEYAFKQIVDVSFDSLVGFTTGVTGCYSCIKFEAIKKQSEPFDYLDNIFQKMVLDDDFVLSNQYNFRVGNMALVGDQMIAYEILTRKDSHFLAKFLPVLKNSFIYYK